ncbi:BlaI/MecI/CopY family transcriptional regulator [Streptomyces noursei]|uniref:BlaI/MecI/CopY family transcriptional regulator n=1 Tax=Streptomyces noursei TaxID=1971 RepID=UPI0030F2625E
MVDDAPVERRESGALEAEVMATLWADGTAMTAGQVHKAIGDGLSYKTVLTVLGRLHVKGLLDRERVGRAHAYTPRQDAAEAAAGKMSAALAQRTDRTAVLQHFVDALDPADEAALRALLDARD